jgi:hypothetical protein
MDNSKLQKLATKMVGLFREDYFESPQICFESFKKIYAQQYEYFGNFNAPSIIKLVLYIYSLKNEGNFKLADSMLNNLGFASLFISGGNVYEVECPDCDGDGHYKCRNCGGDGEIECGHCGSDGQTTCESCGGGGTTYRNGEEENCYECDGDGEVTCSECGGSGSYNCTWCGGSGDINCDKCNGDGYIESSEYEYNYYVIATWNKFIKDRCELQVNTRQPALSEENFDDLRNEFIIIGSDEDHSEFRKWVEFDKFYCTNYDDEPDLFVTKSPTLWMWFNDDKLDTYTL